MEDTTVPSAAPQGNDADIRTSGQKWVGTLFNPSKIPAVDQIENEFAAAADTLERWVGQKDRALTNDEQMLYEAAKTDLLRAQMLCVKLFTYN